MKRIFDKEAIDEAISRSKYKEVLESLNVPMFICEYENGELVDAPYIESTLFQITISGSFSIYFIRNDGSIYHLAYSDIDLFVGDTRLFDNPNHGVYGEAVGILRCLAFSIEESKEALLENTVFLRMLTHALIERFIFMTLQEAVPSSLTDRVILYMTHICKDKTIKGVEKTAYQLHCSPRQLQRILNSLEKENRVKKLGKGKYILNE